MTETTEKTTDEKQDVKDRMARVRAARKEKAAAAPSKAPSAAQTKPPEFEGITKGDCCFDCDEKRCLITHSSHCGHPCKGGLQAAEQRDPATVKRYNTCRRIIAHQEVNKRE